MDQGDTKRVNVIVYRAKDLYEKEVKKAANSVKRAKGKSFKTMDYLEKAVRTIEYEMSNEIKKLGLTYQDQCNAENQMRRVLDDVDKKYFGSSNIPNMWDWVNGNDNWKKLLGENKMVITKTYLKSLVQECINEAQGIERIRKS